ncbi:MAG: PorT family protein, partial [Bacteroidia bacterium]|nr:PorT family protein [Bacteroidia bacterium]
MKNIFFVLSFLFITHCASAQLFSKERIKNIENFDKQRWSWGYYLGFSSFDFNFDYKQNLKDIQVEKTTGFNV